MEDEVVVVAAAVVEQPAPVALRVEDDRRKADGLKHVGRQAHRHLSELPRSISCLVDENPRRERRKAVVSPARLSPTTATRICGAPRQKLLNQPHQTSIRHLEKENNAHRFVDSMGP